MPNTKPPARWKTTQIVEKLRSLARDLQGLATSIVRPEASAAAIGSWHREVAGYLRDMSALIAGELSHSDAALHQAEDLRTCSDVLTEWANHPTDRTGNQGRAAQLQGVAAGVRAFADKIQ